MQVNYLGKEQPTNKALWRNHNDPLHNICSCSIVLAMCQYMSIGEGQLLTQVG